MYVQKRSGYILPEKFSSMRKEKSLLDSFLPKTFPSIKWKFWKAIWDFKLCPECKELHGTICAMDEELEVKPPKHDFCRCSLEPMEAVLPGGATHEKENGADYWLAHYGKLPDYYISDEELRKLGWKNGKPPRRFAPEKMYFGGIYYNDNGHLPSVPGRVWYEADLNYYTGKRNQHRILFSNDGLVFVTYDHYRTFLEIVTGG